MQSDLQHRHAGVMGASVLVFHPEYFPASDDGLARAIASSADAVPAK